MLKTLSGWLDAVVAHLDHRPPTYAEIKTWFPASADSKAQKFVQPQTVKPAAAEQAIPVTPPASGFTQHQAEQCQAALAAGKPVALAWSAPRRDMDLRNPDRSGLIAVVLSPQGSDLLRQTFLVFRPRVESGCIAVTSEDTVGTLPEFRTNLSRLTDDIQMTEATGIELTPLKEGRKPGRQWLLGQAGIYYRDHALEPLHDLRIMGLPARPSRLRRTGGGMAAAAAPVPQPGAQTQLH